MFDNARGGDLCITRAASSGWSCELFQAALYCSSLVGFAEPQPRFLPALSSGLVRRGQLGAAGALLVLLGADSPPNGAENSCSVLAAAGLLHAAVFDAS